jgi:hypothetical protein
MNKTEQAQQFRLAADIFETEHPFEVRYPGTHEWDTVKHICPSEHVVNNCEIRPVLATPPDGRPLHNPDNLTAEQVGLGYRLTRKGERPTPQAQVWMGVIHANGMWQERDVNAEPYYAGSTYRLPLSVPWPLLPIATLAQDQIELTAEQHAAVEACLKEEAPPFQLPPPPPGMEWHLEDGWEEGDLPQGYRPLVDGEFIQVGDEVRNKNLYKSRFVKASSSVGHKAGESFPNQIGRTTRPLTFTHEGKQWTYHRPGDPMPCDGERAIYHIDTEGRAYGPLKSSGLFESFGSDYPIPIIGWRYVETTKQVELGPEDVPPGSVIRPQYWDGPPWMAVSKVCINDCLIEGKAYTWEMLKSWQINRSIPLTGKWDATAWEPCHKPKPLANG